MEFIVNVQQRLSKSNVEEENQELQIEELQRKWPASHSSRGGPQSLT